METEHREVDWSKDENVKICDRKFLHTQGFSLLNQYRAAHKEAILFFLLFLFLSTPYVRPLN